jgi:hypothetical protein
MKLIARLETTSSKGIEELAVQLQQLNNEVVIQDKKVCFIYFNGTVTDLRNAVKASKNAIKFVGSIKAIYGTASTTL